MTPSIEFSPDHNIPSGISNDVNNLHLNFNGNENVETETNEIDPSKILKNLKIKNINRLVIGHLNINSIASKFESLKTIVANNIDILVITESKLDESFPINMFNLEGYTLPFRLDKSINSGGVLIYVKEGIPCHELKTSSYNINPEGIFLEINLRKQKWLLFGGYNNCKSNINTFLREIGPTLDHYMCKLDNFILLGDYNSEMSENAMKEFCDTYNLKNLITEPTCFKNPCNPSSIDVMLKIEVEAFKTPLL